MRDVIVQRHKDLESQREQAETPSSRKLVVAARMQHTQNPPSVSFFLLPFLEIRPPNCNSVLPIIFVQPRWA